MIRLRDNRVPVTQWAEQIEEFKRGYNGDIPASLQEFRPVTLRHAVADGIKQVAALAIKAANAAKTLDFRECYQAELWNKVKQMREAIQREIPDSVVVNVQQGASLAKVPLNLVFSYTTEEYIQRELDKIDIRVNVAAPHNAGPTERWVNNEDKRRKAGGDGGKDNSP